jgi:hypothetical protein
MLSNRKPIFLVSLIVVLLSNVNEGRASGPATLVTR